MSETAGVRKHAPLIVAAVAALGGALLMVYRLGDPIGGFHAFNEGFYLIHALEDLRRSVFAPVYAPTDTNNPWVYAWLLVQWLRVFGSSIAAARALSVAATVAVVLLTYTVGRIAFNDRIAALAAVLTAFTPGLVLVGRNVQIDAVLLALTLGATACYLMAVREESWRWGLAAGVVSGIALMTKLPFVLLPLSLLVWRTWDTRGITWLKEPHTLVTLGSFLVTGLPWYLYRLANPAFVSSQSYMVSTAESLGAATLFQVVFGEMFWMFSPFLSVLVVLGLYHAARARTSADKLMLAVVAVHIVAYLFYHVHSYYYITVIPFGALLAARGLSAVGVRATGRLVAVGSIVTVLLVASSVYTLAGKKYSMFPADQAVKVALNEELVPAETRVELADEYWSFTGNAFSVHSLLAGMPAAMPESAPGSATADAPRLVFAAAGRSGPGVRVGSSIHAVTRAPVVFGYAVAPEFTEESHVFLWPAADIRRVGGLGRFGWVEEKRDLPQLSIYVVEPGAK